MAKPKSGLVCELLENRCLLSGSAFWTALSNQGQPGLIAQPAEAWFAGMAPRAGSVDAGYGVDSGRLADSKRFENEVITRNVSFAVSSGRDQASVPFNPPMALAHPYGGEPIALNDSPAVPMATAGQGFAGREAPPPINMQPPGPAMSWGQGSRYVSMVVEEIPQGPVFVLRRSNPQTVIAEEDTSPQRLNIASILPPPPGKDQSSISGSIRDQGALAVPNVVPIPGAAAKEDRLAAAPLAQTQPSSGAGGALSQGPPVAQLVHNSSERSGQESSAAAMPANQARLDRPEPRLSSGGLSETLSPSAFESALTASAALVTNVLPVDFASLESSVKSFFDDIDRRGVKLSESHVNLLFSSGMMAVAAALTLEIARRRMQPSVPAVTLQREGSIPYSDYP